MRPSLNFRQILRPEYHIQAKWPNLRVKVLLDVGGLPTRPSMGLMPADLSPTSVSLARARFAKGK